MNQVGKKGKGKSKKSKGQSKGKGSSQNQNQKGKGKSTKGQSKGKTKSKGKGQWTTWSGQSWSWNQNQGQGGKGKGKGHQVCSHCGRKGHSVDQCWWAPKISSSGAGSDHQRQVYNISAQPGDHSVSIMPTDQLRGFQDLRPLHQQQPLNQPYFSQPSSSSAVSSVFFSGQGQGFSGHQLRINHFSHQVSQKTTSWRSMSPIPSMTSVHHCLRNVKNLGQLSLIQEQLHQLLLNHLFLTSPSRRIRDPHQRQWWEHQGLGHQACHIHHRQSHHSCQLPHC